MHEQNQRYAMNTFLILTLVMVVLLALRLYFYISGSLPLEDVVRNIILIAVLLTAYYGSRSARLFGATGVALTVLYTIICIETFAD